MNAVQVWGLRRTYKPRRGDAVVALDGLDLAVNSGLVYGLLGPNGAGKTTLVKVLTTVITPTDGSASVLGMNVVKEADKLRPLIGVSYGGELGLYWRLSGRQNLEYACQLYGMNGRLARSRCDELLEQFGLEPAADRRVDGYSRGMRQRLHLARSLVHDPEVLFLDEPTTGLDPVAASEVREIIQSLRLRGRTVFLTTHNMMEADALCDRIAIINKGRLVIEGEPDDLKRGISERTAVDLTFGPDCDSEQLVTRLETELGSGSVTVVQRHHDAVIVTITVQSSLPMVPISRAVCGYDVTAVATRGASLEDVYLTLLRGESERR